MLSGVNSFTGITKVVAGTLALANPLALEGSTFDTSGDGTLNVETATATTLGGLQGAHGLVLQNSAGSPLALSVGNNNSDTTFPAVLSGNGSLIKIGTGKLALGNTNNNYVGGTALAGGTLSIAGDGALGSTASPITLRATPRCKRQLPWL